MQRAAKNIDGSLLEIYFYYEHTVKVKSSTSIVRSYSQRLGGEK